MSDAGSTHDQPSYTADLPGDLEASAAAVAEVAEAWGAQWEPKREAGTEAVAGRLILPRVAGIHRGVLVGRLELTPGVGAPASTHALYRVEDSIDRVHLPSVVVLLASGLGALLTVVWPIWPELLPVVPFGILLALGGWFLVISRLQNSGPEELFHLVEKELEGDDASGHDDPAEAAADSPPPPNAT